MFRDRSTPLVAGAAVMAIVAALLFQGKGSTPPDGEAANKPAAKDPAAKAEEPGSVVEAIGRYFKPSPKARGDGPLTPVYQFLGQNDKDRANDYKWPSLDTEAGAYKVECLIVTVPHPLKSGMGYWYDLTLDAIERALEHGDFVLDRAQIPPDWQTGADPAAASDQPGVLLFRRPQAWKRQLRVVFLVPETPTAGMQIPAFRQSVRLAWSLDPKSVTDIRVVGPYFSGSQESLNLAIGQAIADQQSQSGLKPPPALTFKIHNGSATAIDADTFYEFSDRANVEYDTTVIPDEIVLRWLYKYLDNPSDPAGARPLAKVALLKESDTSYGQSGNDPRGPGGPARTGQPRDVIEIPFPIHISGLQGAHAKALQDKLARLGLPSTAGGIPVSQDEGEKEGARRRAVPSQSPATTAAINDLLIKNILTTLARERVRYVGLVATDPRDKILLATLIKESCPDVRLFTTGGDMLLAHPDFNTAMRGMIVASSYPLDAEPQSFRRAPGRAPNNRRLLFGNQSFQGCFNAVLAHLDESPEPLAVSPRDRMLGYDTFVPANPPSRPALYRPTVWISIIGQNSTIVPVYRVSGEQLANDVKTANLYELALKDNSRKSAAEPDAAPDTQPEFVRQFSTYWLCCLIVLSAAVCWLLYRYLGDATDATGVPADPAAVWPGPVVQRLCLAVAAFVLAGLYGWVACLALLAKATAPGDGAFAWDTGWPGVVNTSVRLVALGMILVVGIFFVKGCLYAPWAAFVRGGRGLAATAAAGVQTLLFLAVLVAAGRLLTWEGDNAVNHWTGEDNDTLYFERVTHPLNGLSPLLPALFLGVSFVGWCFFIHKEYYLYARRAVPNPFDGATDADHPYDALPRLGAELRRGLRWFGLYAQTGDGLRGNAHLVATALAVVFVLAGFGQVLARMLPTIEGAAFDWVLYAGFLAAALLIGHTLGHFYFTWRRLQRVLRDLAWLPLGPAFQRLPAKVKQTFDKALYAQRPGATSVEFIQDQQRLLLAKLPDVEAELATRYPQLAAAASPLVEFRTAPTFLNGLRVLRPVWDSRPLQERYGPATPEEKDKAKPPKDDPANDWLQMAEDYLAIEITFFLSQFYVHLRNLLNAVTVGALLLLLTVSLYPFQPQGLLLVCVVALLASVAAVAVWVLVGINRDEVMSHLAGNTPNRFTPDVNFLREMVQYVVPVLGLVMVQFPAVGSFVRSLIEPLLRVIR